MIRLFALLGAVLTAGMASAQSCPDFYRFVDFGVVDDAGLIYRGGPLLRAENFTEERLLIEDETICLDVWPTLTDGRGNPMPVVYHIAYDPVAVGGAITSLTVSYRDDPLSFAEEALIAHQTTLFDFATKTLRGETYLCALPTSGDFISCQVVSPFTDTLSLMIYCDALMCTMPALPLDDHLLVRATWATPDWLFDAPENLGGAATATIARIHDFLTPLTASF